METPAHNKYRHSNHRNSFILMNIAITIALEIALEINNIQSCMHAN